MATVKEKIAPPSLQVKGERKAQVSASLKSNDELWINFTYDIDRWSFTDLVYYISYFADEYTAIKFIINSPGGDPVHAYAVYDFGQTIKNNGIKISADVYGEAASAAGIVAMTADKENRRIATNALFHMHYATGSGPGADDALLRLNNNFIAMVAMETGMTEDEVRTMLDTGEVYLSADEAIELGFFAEKIPNKKSLTMTNFFKAMAAAVVKAVTPAEVEQAATAAITQTTETKPANPEAETEEEASPEKIMQAIVETVTSQANAIKALQEANVAMKAELLLLKAQKAGSVSQTAAAPAQVVAAGGAPAGQAVTFDATEFAKRRAERLQKAAAGK